MSLFAKPVSQVGTADLQELVDANAVENLRLEFKLLVPSKEDTLKKLSSFANTFGGYLVIGAKAESSDGRIQNVPGVDNEPSYKQKVVQWCFDGASPPLIVEVSDPIPAPSGNNKVCYVVYAAESDLAPHFLNGRRGVWVRTDEFSARFEPRLANENELRHLLDRRLLITQRRAELLRRSQRRFETALSRQSHKEPRTPSSFPRLEVSFGPRFPTQPVCENTELLATLQNAQISWRHDTFPGRGARLVTQHESVLLITARDVRRRVEIVEANIWGLLFYGTELEIEIGPLQTAGLVEETVNGIHLYRVVGYLLAFTEHARQMISQFGYEGPLSIDVGLNDILGVQWLYTQRDIGMYPGPVSDLDNEFAFSFPTTTDSLRNRRDAVVCGMLQSILFGMNWASNASNSSALEELLRTGYRYNSWPVPTALQI